ncbi:hypothetical protein ACFL20_08405 [Spirochaetota bacterium]
MYVSSFKTQGQKIQNFIKKNFLLILTIVSALIVSGCSIEDPKHGFSGTMVVATVASDWSSASHSVVSYDKPRISINNLLPTLTSDITITSHGRYFYRIERFFADNITKFDINATDTPIWQYSTMDSNDIDENITSSNPHSLIFDNDTKAFILRYESSRAWIVDPSAETEGSFKIGELDLSVYNDADGNPEMTAGIIEGNRIYIVMQRIGRSSFPYDYTGTSYVAVFNKDNGTEIDTGKGSGGLKGIPLTLHNPQVVTYYSGKLYISCVGDYNASSPDSGIEVIDTSDFNSTTIASGTMVMDVEIASDIKGYFIEYIEWGNSNLRSFNPASGIINSENIGDIGGGDWNLNDILIDPHGYLWVGDASVNHSGVYVIDTASDTLDEGPISTNLNPMKFTLCEN